MEPEFRNEAFLDFTDPENRKGMEKALEEVLSKAGETYPLVIGGERLQAETTFDSLNPSDPGQVLGHFQKATPALAEKALQAANDAFPAWSRTPATKRADLLFRAAEIMRDRRHILNAWMVLETGKSWAEADGDTAEAIDFLEFYGREMLRYAGEQPLTKVPGEENELQYIPLGAGIVIPPWNFPNAILCGMSSAAVVCGNTVVLKPSSDSPGLGYQFTLILEEAGIPPGVLNYLSGPGSLVGKSLVGHPKTRFIAFTGSKEVGLGINASAARTAEGQIWIKRVIAEMGGKDSIIVDGEVDLDAAVQGVFVSAFGYQGQKCSACSRAIVDETVYDEFLRKLKEKVGTLKVGPVRNFENNQGPVINEGAMKTILDYIEVGKSEGRLVAGGGRAEGAGFFVEPTVIADVDPMARISQEEIFGPVLAVFKAKGYDHALEIANNTEYGLTGSVYTTNEEKQERAKREFHVGNLYINRKCTGALVGGHPFGGFNMSGTDSKAGGRDYLLLFLQAKAISKKI